MVLSALLWQYIYLRLLCLYSLWIFIIFLQTSFIFIKSNSACCKVYFHIKLLCCNFITKDLNNPENLVQHRIFLENQVRIPWNIFITLSPFSVICLSFSTSSMCLTWVLFSSWFIEVSPCPVLLLFFCFFLFEFLWAFVKKFVNFFFKIGVGKGKRNDTSKSIHKITTDFFWKQLSGSGRLLNPPFFVLQSLFTQARTLQGQPFVELFLLPSSVQLCGHNNSLLIFFSFFNQ